MLLRSQSLLPILFVLGSGCSAGESLNPVEPEGDPPYVPPDEACESPDLDQPGVFAPCNLGSGIFGTWIVDDHGQPAYDYGLDQHADERARFFNTEGLDRRDHWSAIGNRRINALVFNDGYVEVTTQDRGVAYLDKFDPEAGNFAGGFSYLDDGSETWCSAYAFRPKGSTTTRRFGMGYAEASTAYRSVRLSRRWLAPVGDDPVLIDEVTLENTGGSTRKLKHYEVWDVARRPIDINWSVSGNPITTFPGTARAERDRHNDRFVERVSFDAEAGVLGLRRTHADGVKATPRGQPSPHDDWPGDPFLLALDAEVHDTFADQRAFFGDGGPAAPEAVVSRAEGQGAASGEKGMTGSGKGQPRMFALRTNLELAPGEKRTLRFAFGYAPMGEPYPSLAALRSSERDHRTEIAADLREHSLTFVSPDAPALHRELAWHASQIEVSVGFREYWNVNVVPQGSAYLYLHGADGAARDLSLFAVPLVYTHAALAKQELALNMMITHAADKRISYAFQGHGMLDDALELHTGPSDLPIFLLWGLSEYIGATGDVAFLDEKMPYYPLEALPDATVLDHAKDAVRYLFDVVGTGDHGLLRITTGDWSDGIVLEAPDLDLAIAEGESVPNTQMAVAVLPRVADMLEERAPALAAEIRGRLDTFRIALRATWTGSFFGRAYFGDDNLAYADKVNLESQVWGLIGGTFAEASDRDKLVAVIRSELDEPSPFGATLLPGGQVWPAISGLLTWGYAESDPDLALRHLARNTMASHAVAYPEIWYGIWSGPDGMNGPGLERPGESWYSVVTPMIDFPVMNNNQHAMPLLAAIRVAGITATASGLRVAPGLSGDVVLKTELVDVAKRGALVSGVYRPRGATVRTLELVAPKGSTIRSAKRNGEHVDIGSSAASIVLLAESAAATSFECVVE